MDVDEFSSKVTPGRSSRLLPYKEGIRKLKKRGYSDQHISEWLAENKIVVSRESVRKFIKRHLPELKEGEVSGTGAAGESAEISAPDAPAESQAEKMRRQLFEQQRDAEQTQFKHDRTGNNI